MPALQHMIKKARSEASSALVIIKDGKLITEEYFGNKDTPIMAMSVSKSFVSLAIGFLLEEGKIKSLEMKMSDVFTEWKNSPKEKITLYQMLTHTSGINPARTLGKMVKGKWLLGKIADGLHGPLISEPGKKFRYNNRAVDLLALFVGRVSGKVLDVYLQEKLFSKLGIRSVSWMKDAAGVPRGAGEMSIHPIDLAKVGLLMLQKGMWRGKRIIPESWIVQSWKASRTNVHCGLLWWRRAKEYKYALTEAILKNWEKHGANKNDIATLKGLVGKSMRLQGYRKAIKTALGNAVAFKRIETAMKKGGPLGKITLAGGLVFLGAGWLGQYLAIDTKNQLVAVRMRHATKQDQTSRVYRNGYQTFVRDVFSLPVAK
ncbi:MAG: serine hydrolase [Myxococcales bacterium]|nr:serine hydrolase [Myxococcales bacterium]